MSLNNIITWVFRRTLCSRRFVDTSIIPERPAYLDFQRLTQALVNNEVAESSHRNALQELQEVQANAARLAAQNARSIGWENRLAVALQEKDDYQQERDIALQRAKLAEARISALKEKCGRCTLVLKYTDTSSSHHYQPNRRHSSRVCVKTSRCKGCIARNSHRRFSRMLGSAWLNCNNQWVIFLLQGASLKSISTGVWTLHTKRGR